MCSKNKPDGRGCLRWWVGNVVSAIQGRVRNQRDGDVRGCMAEWVGAEEVVLPCVWP